MARVMVALLLTLITSALHSVRGQAAAPSRFAGCFMVSIGLWSPALGGDAPLHAIPASVRLDTIPVEHVGGWRLSPNVQHAGPSAMRGTPRWRMAGTDVRLIWSDGVALTIAQLIPQPGDTLLGEVVALSDGQPEPDPDAQWWTKEPPGPRAPALLKRRPCSERARVADRPSSTPWSADSALANRVAGCYELVGSSWQADSALASITRVPRGPVRFELTNVPDPNATRLAASDLATYFETRSSELFSTWRRLSDTEPRILVSRPLPMAGFALDVALHGTDLVGSISAFTDAAVPDGKSEAGHAVTARRISCSSLR